tara:strand:- start:161 stop:295 length:135 start_codon:yes stop_codon:yes gene_type:complete
MEEEKLSRQGEQLKRIADTLEEILRLVKEDQEKMRRLNDEKNAS